MLPGVCTSARYATASTICNWCKQAVQMNNNSDNDNKVREVTLSNCDRCRNLSMFWPFLQSFCPRWPQSRFIIENSGISVMAKLIAWHFYNYHFDLLKATNQQIWQCLWYFLISANIWSHWSEDDSAFDIYFFLIIKIKFSMKMHFFHLFCQSFKKVSLSSIVLFLRIKS